MNYEEIAKIDLNLLKILKVLGEEKNTRRTAERMFVGQSTISKALKKLRELFEDEMFIRKAHGLSPTPKCEAVLMQLPVVFEAIDGMFNPFWEFNPSTYPGDITIAVNPSYLQPIMKRLYPKLRAQAPLAELKLVNWMWDTEAKLQQGQVDIGINFSILDTSIKVRNEPICKAKYGVCCLVDSEFAQAEINVNSLSQQNIVLMLMPDFADRTSFIERVLAQAQLSSQVVFRSDQLSTCLEAITQENAIMPTSTLVRTALPEEMTMRPLPAEIPNPGGDISLYYSNINRQNPKIAWLRELLSETILEME